MVIWERTVMKQKLQSNDFLKKKKKNEINEMKKKIPLVCFLWCVYSVYFFICFEQYLNYVVRH